MVFGDGAFGQALMKGNSALKKRDPRELLLCGDTVRNWLSLGQESGPRQRTNLLMP